MKWANKNWRNNKKYIIMEKPSINMEQSNLIYWEYIKAKNAEYSIKTQILQILIDLCTQPRWRTSCNWNAEDSCGFLRLKQPESKKCVHAVGGSSLNGNRTRISTLRGSRPKPLDDKAIELWITDYQFRNYQSAIRRRCAAPLGVEPRLSWSRVRRVANYTTGQ